jgi:sucrose-phosphate synthase
MDLENFGDMEGRYRFSRRITAERLSMARAFRIITSTSQERFEQYAHPLYRGAVDTGEDGMFSVIPPGVNTGVFTTEPGGNDSRVGRAIEETLKGAAKPCIVVSSRLDEKKNHLGVVRAYASSAELRRTADLVILIRGVDDPCSDIACLPEQERSILRPILDVIEADACGLAVVATENGGPSEIFEDGSGILVDPFDEGSIADGLVKGIARHGHFAELGRRRVREKYTWEKTAEAYLSVIQEGAGKSHERDFAIPELDATERIREYLTEKGR